MTYDLESLGLLDDDEIELDHAALALSALDHEGADLDPYLGLLDEISNRLEEIAGSYDPLETQGAALSQVLADEYGFIGDASGYDAPANADMMRVLDRRQGLPVSLSILYVAAARRIGWEAWALNTPGHVVVRLGRERFMLLDPFHGGRPVSRGELEAMVRQFVGPDAEVRPEYLAPIPNRLVLVRLLTNQASRALQGGDTERALAVHERMARIAPGYPDVWLSLARLQAQTGDSDGARSSLHALLEITRDEDYRSAANELLERLGAG